MKTYIKIVIISMIPALAIGARDDVYDLLDRFSAILDSIVVLMFAAAVFLFFWGLTSFIKNSADTGKHAQGRNMMIGGIVALFVMSSIYGLVSLVQNTANLDDRMPDFPTVNVKR